MVKVKIDPKLDSDIYGYHRDPKLQKAIEDFKITMLKEMPELIKTVSVIWFTLLGVTLMLWIEGKL